MSSSRSKTTQKLPGEVIAALRCVDHEDLLRQTCRKWGVDPMEIVAVRGRGRNAAHVCSAKHELWHRLYDEYCWSKNAIAKAFGMDWSTVQAALKKFEDHSNGP